MPAALPGAVERRRAALARALKDADAELRQVSASLDRYEKSIEAPRLLAEIRQLEAEIQAIDLA
jgi:hypothetical protein